MADLSTPLKGIVGTAASKLRTSRGLVDVADFLAFLPRRYIDPAKPTDLSALHEDEYTAVVATVRKATTHPMRQRRGTMLNVVVADQGSHEMTLTFFKPFGHIDRLKPGRTGLFAGKIQRFKGTWQLAHPNYELFDEEDADDAMETYAGGLLPIYLEVPKLDSWNITKAARLVFHQLDDVPEPVPAELRSRHHLVGLLDAYRLVHLPRTWADVKRGLDRLRYDEA
ncbi:MAG: ATP-dependent DNA helicase RecG, partial [Chloroflexota bacterium]|nr:ATP-dependent DNA helicase RecG [Chloroflexota bacterium]